MSPASTVDNGTLEKTENQLSLGLLPDAARRRSCKTAAVHERRHQYTTRGGRLKVIHPWDPAPPAPPPPVMPKVVSDFINRLLQRADQLNAQTGQTPANLVRHLLMKQDPHNTGRVRASHLKNEMKQLGLHLRDNQCVEVIQYYDTEGLGSLPYANLVADLDQRSNVIVPPQDWLRAHSVHIENFCDTGRGLGVAERPPVVAKFETNLLSKAAKAARERGGTLKQELNRQFRTMDRNNSHSLSRNMQSKRHPSGYEVPYCMKVVGLEVTPDEVETFMRHYDRNRDGSLSYNELLQHILDHPQLEAVSAPTAPPRPTSDGDQYHIGVSTDDVITETVLQVLSEKAHAAATHGVGMARVDQGLKQLFMSADNGTGKVGFPELCTLIKIGLRLDVSSEGLKHVARRFNLTNGRRVSFKQFASTVHALNVSVKPNYLPYVPRTHANSVNAKKSAAKLGRQQRKIARLRREQEQLFLRLDEVKLASTKRGNVRLDWNRDLLLPSSSSAPALPVSVSPLATRGGRRSKLKLSSGGGSGVGEGSGGQVGTMEGEGTGSGTGAGAGMGTGAGSEAGTGAGATFVDVVNNLPAQRAIRTAAVDGRSLLKPLGATTPLSSPIQPLKALQPIQPLRGVRNSTSGAATAAEIKQRNKKNSNTTPKPKSKSKTKSGSKPRLVAADECGGAGASLNTSSGGSTLGVTAATTEGVKADNRRLLEERSKLMEDLNKLICKSSGMVQFSFNEDQRPLGPTAGVGLVPRCGKRRFLT